MRTIKLSILSLLFFGGFNAQVLAGECSRESSKESIPHSFYDENTNPPSCTCISGYGDNGTIKRNKDGKFSGTCTLIEDSTSSSPATWAVPVAAMAIAGTGGVGYYIYRIRKVNVESGGIESENIEIVENVENVTMTPEERINMEFLTKTFMRSINDKNVTSFNTDDSYVWEIDDPESVTSEIEQIHSDLTSAESNSLSMVDETYTLPKSIDQLPIETHEVMIHNDPSSGELPGPSNPTAPSPENEASGGDYTYVEIDENHQAEWDFRLESDSDDEISLDGLSNQVKDVQENVLEDARLDEVNVEGEVRVNVGDYFESQTTSNPGASNLGETDTIISDPAYEDINKWNKEKALEDSDSEGCE
ncbi:hypothetical protein [Bathymodiolus thermophilus thioautotrophic gill symbiont]|uniref:Uncharacterized protein n=1 Tax=Bathymodiolus thermophilus thioautotrophic gill symbiont TaxID=2360 RepID=A0A1J5U8Q3_9GAMM|nr:hypothetical protein [Bathymodiolus thermophilus thioautotrophic gill symbiont]OIR25230.1 hypothetical protein BGC33_12900 [Bathymodiolus thermophilus thioautotrophic gill symbiont]